MHSAWTCGGISAAESIVRTARLSRDPLDRAITTSQRGSPLQARMDEEKVFMATREGRPVKGKKGTMRSEHGSWEIRSTGQRLGKMLITPGEPAYTGVHGDHYCRLVGT